MPTTRTSKAGTSTGIKQAMFSLPRRAATTRATSAVKTERESVLSNVRHMVQNSVLFGTVSPAGRLVCSSMKISSFQTQVHSAYTMVTSGTLPEGFRADNREFSLEPGKNKWDVAIYRAFTSQDSLWFMPSEGLAMTESALQKIYTLRDEKGRSLVQEYVEQRTELLKKMGTASYKTTPFPTTVEGLKAPEYGVNLNALLQRPNFTALVATLARACHSMTGSVACSNLTESAIADPVSLAKFNQFLSAYVVEETGVKAPSRTGYSFSSLLHTLRSVHMQQAENNRNMGQATELKYTTCEIGDSSAGGKYSVKAHMKTANAEDLQPKGKATEREKRQSIAEVLISIDGVTKDNATSNAIKAGILNRLIEEAAKAAPAGTHPERITQNDVEYLVQHIFFTHIAITLPTSQKRYLYPAALLRYHDNKVIANPTAATMLYFFLKRYEVDSAADELFNNVITNILANFPTEAQIYLHLKNHFTAKGETSRTRGHAFSGFEAASATEAREFDNSAAAARQQALAAAAAATRRSPSPAPRQVAAAAGGWNNQAQQPSGRSWVVPGAAGTLAPRAAATASEQQAPIEVWTPPATTGPRASSQAGWEQRQGSVPAPFRAPSGGPAAGAWGEQSKPRQNSGARVASESPSRPPRQASGSAPWDQNAASWTPAVTGSAWNPSP